MIPTKLLSSFIFLLISTAAINAQTQTGQKIEKTHKDVKVIDSTFKTIKNIFKGKGDKKNKQTERETSSPSPATNTDSNATSAVKIADNSQLKAGDIAPNAVYLDVDALEPFNMGAAVVRKGSATTIIDAKGNLIIPFNTYVFSGNGTRVKPLNRNFNNGIFQVLSAESNPGFRGYLNAAGKVINDKGELLIEDYWNSPYYTLSLKNRYFVYQEPAHPGISYTIFTMDGKKYKFAYQLRWISEDIGIFIEGSGDNDNIRNYRTIEGKSISQRYYFVARPFQEGFAVVGVKDAFGKVKYGFIDKKGREVIPLIYSNEPQPFRNGFSRIVPQDVSEFEYAFINKSGNIVLKQTLADLSKSFGHVYMFNKNGLCIKERVVVDTTGKVVKHSDFLANYNIKDGFIPAADLSLEYLDQGRIPFSNSRNINPFTHELKVGSVNINNGKVIEAVFDKDDYYLYFDPVSGLAYAKMCIGKDTHGRLQYREGYINEDGVFVILKSPGSTW